MIFTDIFIIIPLVILILAFISSCKSEDRYYSAFDRYQYKAMKSKRGKK